MLAWLAWLVWLVCLEWLRVWLQVLLCSRAELVAMTVDARMAGVACVALGLAAGSFVAAGGTGGRVPGVGALGAGQEGAGVCWRALLWG